MEKLFTPSDVASLTGVEPETQRVLRNRGLLNDCGFLQDNGRWLYSLNDVTAIWIGQYLSRYELSNDDNYLIGKIISSDTMSAIVGNDVLEPIISVKRFHQNISDQEIEVGGSIKRWGSTSDLPDYDFCAVLNVYEIAKETPENLRLRIQQTLSA